MGFQVVDCGISKFQHVSELAPTAGRTRCLVTCCCCCHPVLHNLMPLLLYTGPTDDVALLVITGPSVPGRAAQQTDEPLRKNRASGGGQGAGLFCVVWLWVQVEGVSAAGVAGQVAVCHVDGTMHVSSASAGHGWPSSVGFLCCCVSLRAWVAQ